MKFELPATHILNKIRRVVFYHLKLPLKRPYALSFKTLTEFDTLIAELETVDGNFFYGESTALPGYADETIETMWAQQGALVESFRKQLPGREFPAFSLAPLQTALEAMRGFPAPNAAGTRIPLVGALLTENIAEIETELNQLVKAGFKTVKVKVGKICAQDIAYVQEVLRCLPIGARIRVDANQGFGEEDAIQFANDVEDERIELFEEPIQKKDWPGYGRVSKRIGIALMLDESFDDEADFKEFAHCRNICWIKFKLMKAGGIQNLMRLIRAAQDRKYNIILGNGVAADLNCLYEAEIWQTLGLTAAGEMNGLLKLHQPLFQTRLSFQSGALELGADSKSAVRRNEWKPYIAAEQPYAFH